MDVDESIKFNLKILINIIIFFFLSIKLALDNEC